MAGGVRQGAHPGAQRGPSGGRPHHDRHGFQPSLPPRRERRGAAHRGGRPRHPSDGPPRDHVPAPLGRGGGRPRAASMSIITLTTDFGAADPFVGVMKAVIAGRARAARVIDLTHGIPPQDVLAGALVLRHSVPYFPRGTIHLAVVDPGVGSERRALCVEAAGALLVGPDNGLLSLATPRGDIRRITHLTEERFFLTPRSATFHGRDVFAPIAAALAAGTPVEKLGSEVRDMQRLQLPPVVREARALPGQGIYVDHFGHPTTNVSAADPAAPAVHVPSLPIRSVRPRGASPSYAAVQRGEPVAVVNSWGLLEIAVREGSARDQLGAGVGTAVVIEA